MNKIFFITALGLALTPFMRELGQVQLFGIYIDIISFSIYLISFFIFLLLGKLYIRKYDLFVFLLIIFFAIISIINLSLPLFPFFKQLLPILLFYFVARTILANYDPIRFFKYYINYSVIAAFLGLIQFCLKLMGIKFLTGWDQLFLDSVAFEPSHYVVMIIPSFIYYFEKKDYNWKFIVIGLSLVLTFKLTFILTFLTYYAMVRVKNWKAILFTIPVFIFAAIYIVENVPSFMWRVESAMTFFTTQDMSSINNMTVFSFFSNLYIAIEGFIKSYGLGVGFGGHETMYLRHFNFDILSDAWYGTNMKAAHSLWIRILSELGVLGLTILFLLFYKTFKIINIEYKIISLACLSHFIAKFFKTGSYFDYGTIVFLVMIITLIQLDKKELE